MSPTSHPWRTARLVYKGVETDDDDFLFEMRCDSLSFLNSDPSLPTPPTRQDATKYREYLQKCPLAVILCLPSPSNPPPAPTDADTTKSPLNTAPFTPPPKETLTPIGEIHLRTPEDGEEQLLHSHHRGVDIGITIHEDYQGQGYGSEAIRWVLEWAFRRANLHRVGIGAFGWNEGAVRLYQKLGFVIEGRVREAFWHDGAYRDAIDMGMLRHEWEALQLKNLAPEDVKQQEPKTAEMPLR